MLNPPLTVCLCGVILFCHGALEYWDGKTNWGKGMKDVFLKKLTGKASICLLLPCSHLTLNDLSFLVVHVAEVQGKMRPRKTLAGAGALESVVH